MLEMIKRPRGVGTGLSSGSMVSLIIHIMKSQ